MWLLLGVTAVPLASGSGRLRALEAMEAAPTMFDAQTAARVLHSSEYPLWAVRRAGVLCLVV